MPTGLRKREGRYSILRVIPKDLQDHYGRKVIVRALGTSNYKEAKRLLSIEWEAFEAEFEALRASRTKPATLPPRRPDRDLASITASVLTFLRRERETEAARGRLEFFMEDQRSAMQADQDVLDGRIRPDETLNDPPWSLLQHEAFRNARRIFLTGEGAGAGAAMPPQVTSNTGRTVMRSGPSWPP
jgi:hypothetical protein